MEPRVVEKPQIILVGVASAAASVREIDIAGMWERFARDGEDVAHAVEGVGYELHMQTGAERSVHFCLVGVEVSEAGPLPPDMFAKVLPPCTYAVFTHRLVDGYPSLYEGIEDWLGSSGYEEAHRYDFQLYDSRFKGMDDPESVQDIYVPIRRK